MADYILFRDKSSFLLTNGNGGFSSSTLNGLVAVLERPDLYTRICGQISIPESFDDGRIPLSKDEREAFLKDYFST